MRNPFLLMEYLKDRQLYYCPDTPECAKPWLASNYSFNGLPRPGTPARGRAIAHFQRIMDLEGSNYPIMTCMAHDEMYYFPRESDLSPEFNPPFVIDLLADGAIRAKRRKLQRTFDLWHHCQLGERK
jgi:hypothetical protein